MEITLNRKNIAIAAILLLLALAVMGAYASGLFSPRPPARNVSADEPAVQALRAIYNPDPSAGQRAWEESVCAGTTEQGCGLFRSLFAPSIWDAALAGKMPGGEPAFAGVAEDLGVEGQIWAFTVGAAPVYVHVQRDEDQRWLLARILFEEEARQRYGGG